MVMLNAAARAMIRFMNDLPLVLHANNADFIRFNFNLLFPSAAANRDDIILVGLDGIVEALRAVADGTISADVAQRPDLMGEYAVKYGLEFLQTGKIDPVITTPMTLALPDNVEPLIAAWEALGF